MAAYPVTTADRRQAASKRVNTQVLRDVLVHPRRKRDRAAAALQESEEWLRLALETGELGVWKVDLASATIACDQRCQEIFGLDHCNSAVPLAQVLATIHPEDRAAVDAALAHALDPASTGTYATEQRVVQPDGSVRWIVTKGQARLTGEPRGAMRLVGMAADVTARKRVEELIRALALHDPLTGLPNRTLFQDRLNQALARTRREGGVVAVMVFDLGGLKEVNDTFGYAAGDWLLRQVADRLLPIVGVENSLARLGRDEFALVQAGMHPSSDATTLAGKVLAALTAPFEIDAQEVHVSTSLGVTLSPPDKGDAEMLLRHANLALHHAKTGRRSWFRFFEPVMEAEACARRQLEQELRRALERGEFVLHYQPQLDLTSGRFIGAEALVRWLHPKRGLVAPGEFVPLAEATGLIRPLGTWVLQEACRQAAAWRAAGLALTVAVNLSPVELRHGEGSLPRVGRALKRAGLAPAELELELTEGVLMETFGDKAEGFLRRLTARGVGLAIDDFGVGYSSLAYLRRLPAQKIKVDRSFVREIGVNAEGDRLVKSIVALGQSLGKRVVAEGVETEAQLAFLRATGCDVAQGYYLAPPLPAKEIKGLVAR